MAAEISASPRLFALKALIAVDESGAYTNLSLERFLSHSLSSADKALLVQLVYGTVSMQLAIDFQLNSLMRKPIDTLPAAIRNILRLGAYQIMYLAKIPPHAAVNEAVKLAHRFGHIGTARLVNAVLRRLAPADALIWPEKSEDCTHYLSVRYSHPPFLVARWVRQLGAEETEGLMRANNLPPRFSIRVNATRIGVHELSERLLERDFTVEAGQYVPEILYPSPTPSFADELFTGGYYSVQGEASAMCGHFLAPAPRERVVDLCAAPGGKTTHLAELMGDEGEIFAFDRNAKRLQLVVENATRLGLRSIRTIHREAHEALAVTGEVEKVLLDAPCSGLGVLRHKPDLRYRHSDDTIRQLAANQSEMLRSAAQLVARGGTLVYSVCTTEPEETTEVVGKFLALHGDFAEVKTLPRRLKLKREPRRGDGPGYHFWPHRDGMDGFYIAALRRAGI
ncbi:MAG: 16S rRNA (cytosine(967)-C(5))-methyltransferase RsmB [Selenomonadales bacterium]|nr:16S rRNA (cytosine(967)-C(5))-methyltransferase RsmB [Selenomonadales bacterium]